jgi:hypothetical protein
MTSDDFRRLALAMKGVVEGAHQGHPDFRAHGRVVASLRASGERGMVKLSREDQATMISEHPGVFEAEAGAWGDQGYTRVWLANADEESVGWALTRACAAAKPAKTPKPKLTLRTIQP